jgi:hypothetical protein
MESSVSCSGERWPTRARRVADGEADSARSEGGVDVRGKDRGGSWPDPPRDQEARVARTVGSRPDLPRDQEDPPRDQKERNVPPRI